VLYINILLVLYNFLTLPVESSREAAMSPLPYANQTPLDQVHFVGAQGLYTVCLLGRCSCWHAEEEHLELEEDCPLFSFF